MKPSVVAGILFLAALHAPAQANDVAVERLEKNLNVNADGTFEQVTVTTIRLLSEQGAKGVGQIPLTYSESRQTLRIDEAYTVKPDGTKIPVPPDKIFTQGATVALNAPQFNDIKHRIIVFPDVERGGKIHFKATLVETTPSFPGHFTHVESLVPPVTVDLHILRVSAPSSMKLRVSAKGVDTGAVTPAQKTPGRDQWEWKLTGIVANRMEPYQLTGMDVGHHIVFSSFADWQGLAAAYRSRAADKAKVTPAIQALADELTKGLDDPREQARAIAHWTTRNIRYVAVMLGLGGFVPRESAEILATKYGDCKDYSVLMEALLKAKGIESQPALVNANASYKLPEIAAVSAFNHAILYLPKLDMYVDGTASFNRFGTLPYPVSGKPVLLTDFGRIATTPRNTAKNNAMHTKVTLSILPTGDVLGKSIISTEGNFESALRQRLADTPAGQRDSLITSLLGNDQRGSGSYWSTDPNDLDKPLTFTSQYVLPNAVDIQSPGAFRIPTGVSAASIHQAVSTGGMSAPIRRTPFQCGSDARTEHYEIDLTADMKVAALPRDITHKTATLSFEATYRQEGRKIIVQRKLIRTREQEYCDPSIWSETHSMQAVLARDARAQVILQ